MDACSIKVRGVVQGVGFRPFVFRLARVNTLAGWVLNGNEGVEIFVEGAEENLQTFVEELRATPPAAARITAIDICPSQPAGLHDFTIRDSASSDHPTARISPDLPVCEDCLRELFDPTDARHGYPYINCTNCGPRFSVTLGLPYDRPNTTMRGWPLDAFCADQFGEPTDRRFHAQPVACPACGPSYFLRRGERTITGSDRSIQKAARLLVQGAIVAIKGLGGYHLACNATSAPSVLALRERKYRKEKPFAVMARDLALAREIVDLSPEAENLLTSTARPIVLAPAKHELLGIAPNTTELGVMLPYTPLHHLLFAAGAPKLLAMTSANRSSEPIAYDDLDALGRLSTIADAFLVGERPIARRVDDSVARAGAFGPAILRRARGYAPGAVTTIPTSRPILALGADLKNTITLVVDGQAFVSQHIGDLADYESFRAFQETIDDLLSMYEVDYGSLLVACDGHPEYSSTGHAQTFDSCQMVAIQHHRAHIASVLAEGREWSKRVLGVSFDGTGFGDDGTIWGGEFFVGSIDSKFRRVAHLRRASLPGGDAAARYPVQAAAGFLAQLNDLPSFDAEPFSFADRYRDSQNLLAKGVRTFTTTSMGRLFDAGAALMGFTREVSFEGQAAMWLEQLARTASATDEYGFPFAGDELDFRPLLRAVVLDRVRGRPLREIARAFQRGIAVGLAKAALSLCEIYRVDMVVLSGGVFQNELLLEDLHELFEPTRLVIRTNHEVPANDGGISLGQAALAAFHHFDSCATEMSYA